jgi:hypothetical protein
MPVSSKLRRKIMAEQNNSETTQGNSVTNGMGPAFEKAGLDKEAFNSPEAIKAARARRMAKAREAGMGSAQDMLRRKREQERAKHADKEKELREQAEEATRQLQIDEKGLREVRLMSEEELEFYALALRDQYVADNNNNQIPNDKKVEIRNAVAEWIEEFNEWVKPAKDLLYDGVETLLIEGEDGIEEVAVTSGILIEGFNAWKVAVGIEESEAEARKEEGRKQYSQKQREVLDAERQALRSKATVGTLHEARERESGGIVCVSRQYTLKVFKDGEGFVPVPRDDGKGLVMRTGTFLLTVRDGHGQILHPPVGMSFLNNKIPHPERPVPLYPERDFCVPEKRDDLRFSDFIDAVQEMLSAQWQDEERVMEHKARQQKEAMGRAERRQTDAKMWDVAVAGTAREGARAGGELPAGFTYFDRAGCPRLWIKVVGDGRLLPVDFEPGRTPQGKNPLTLDISAFPPEGVSLTPEEGEPRGANFFRAMVRAMGEREYVLDSLGIIRSNTPDTVDSAEALLDATSKASWSAFKLNWQRGNGQCGFAIGVDNTGRGKSNRTIRVTSFFSTDPEFVIPVGTEVPANLQLAEDASNAQKELARILHLFSGRRVVHAKQVSTETKGEMLEPAEESVSVEGEAGDDPEISEADVTPNPKTSEEDVEEVPAGTS